MDLAPTSDSDVILNIVSPELVLRIGFEPMISALERRVC
jgi:hypothetical protein